MSTQYFKIHAPYPAIASTVLLPQPDVGNAEGLTAGVVVLRMDDGSTRSFIKRGSNTKRHQWAFLLSFDKADELMDLLERYRGDTFKVEWRGRTVIGKLNSAPIESNGQGRAGGWPGDEARSVSFELVEVPS